MVHGKRSRPWNVPVVLPRRSLGLPRWEVGSTTSRWDPETDEEYDAAVDELKDRFAAWATSVEVDVDPEGLAEGLLQDKSGCRDGHLTRWTRRDLNEIYLELYPAEVTVKLDDLDEVLEEARMFLTFLSETGLIDDQSEPVEVLVDHLDRIAGRFRTRMADTSRYSFAKWLGSEAAAEGVTPEDPEAFEAFMERSHARYLTERDAASSGAVGCGKHWAPAGRVTPSGTPPRPGPTKRRKRR